MVCQKDLIQEYSRWKWSQEDLEVLGIIGFLSFFISELWIWIHRNSWRALFNDIFKYRKTLSLFTEENLHYRKWVDDTSKQIVEEGMKSVVIIKEIISQGK